MVSSADGVVFSVERKRADEKREDGVRRWENARRWEEVRGVGEGEKREERDSQRDAIVY